MGRRRQDGTHYWHTLYPLGAEEEEAGRRRRRPDRVYHNVVFRNHEGALVEDVFTLCLSDFIPEAVLQQLPTTLRSCMVTLSIKLPYTFLYLSLVEADYEELLGDMSTLEPALARLAKRMRWDTEPEANEEMQTKRPRTRSVSRSEVPQNIIHKEAGHLPERRRTRSISRRGNT